MQLPIYMDNHATTPVDPAVLDCMLPFLKEHFGNASSRTHSFGWVAEEAVSEARSQVSGLLGAASREIIFTSGATESNFIALRGAALAAGDRGRHIVTSTIEHKAAHAPLAQLARQGFSVTQVPVNPDGIIDLDALRVALRGDTILISIMAANNEIGTLQPLEEIGAIARDRDILFHTDAAQAMGKIPIDVDRLGIDLLSISGHKIYAPKGVGALFVRRRLRNVRLTPIIDGGGQEKGLRSGTINVPGIVALGKACELAHEHLGAEAERILEMRNRLHEILQEKLEDIHVNGSLERRLPGNLNVSFAGVQGESLLMQMNDVAVSPGAACDSQDSEPSHVMKAIGLSDDLSRSSIRFGIGRFNTMEEINYVAAKVVAVVENLRRMSPLYGETILQEENHD